MKYNASDKVQVTLGIVLSSAFYDNPNSSIVLTICKNLGIEWVRESLSKTDGILIPSDYWKSLIT